MSYNVPFGNSNLMPKNLIAAQSLTRHSLEQLQIFMYLMISLTHMQFVIWLVCSNNTIVRDLILFLKEIIKAHPHL